MSTAYFDIDSQLDFLYPAGALYVPGAEKIVPAIARLNRLAAERKIPVISTVDAHTESDPEFQSWPHHCVAGAWGQRKAESTLLARRVVIPNRECELALDGAEQVIVEKQTVDAFTSVNFARVIEKLGVERCVIYGVVTEICVWHAISGLCAAGKRVTLVTDAVETLDREASARTLADALALGCAMTSVAQLLQEAVQ